MYGFKLPELPLYKDRCFSAKQLFFKPLEINQLFHANDFRFVITGSNCDLSTVKAASISYLSAVKKLLKWLILLGFLLVVGTYFYSKSGSSTFESKSSAFSIADPSILDRVEITGPYGRTVVLDRWEDSEKWTVDKRFVARPDAVKTLLETLRKMRINFPAAKAARENVMRKMKESPRTVKLYSKGEHLKTIIMGGSPQGATKGTYMMIDGTEDIFVVHIPGFEGFMESRFFVDVQDWRTRIAINSPKADIKRLRVSYPNDNKSSFEITAMEGGQWDLKPLATLGQETVETPQPEFSQRAISSYLDEFAKLPVEAYENFYPRRDSLSKTPASTVIEIESKDGKESKLTIFPMPLTERSKTQEDRAGNKMKYDLDRYFMEFNGGRDWAIIQHRMYAPVLRSYKDFVKK